MLISLTIPNACVQNLAITLCEFPRHLGEQLAMSLTMKYLGKIGAY